MTRIRYAHQVTAIALLLLHQEAYITYVSTNPTEKMDFQAWCTKQSKNYPQFQYWSHTSELEVIVLLFVRSIRESNFSYTLIP